MQNLGHLVRQLLLLPAFTNSSSYWEKRYRLGGTSGEGSYGTLAAFKARTLNELIRKYCFSSVIELGCGDGNQLGLIDYPSYLGLDVSQRAIEICRQRYSEDTAKSFIHYVPQNMANISDFLNADATLSLDVIFHLVEDEVYEKYISDLFSFSSNYVVIYSSDQDKETNTPHVRHRNITRDISRRFPDFRIVDTIENAHPELSPCKFFVYKTN